MCWPLVDVFMLDFLTCFCSQQKQDKFICLYAYVSNKMKHLSYKCICDICMCSEVFKRIPVVEKEFQDYILALYMYVAILCSYNVQLLRCHSIGQFQTDCLHICAFIAMCSLMMSPYPCKLFIMPLCEHCTPKTITYHTRNVS